MIKKSTWDRIGPVPHSVHMCERDWESSWSSCFLRLSLGYNLCASNPKIFLIKCSNQPHDPGGFYACTSFSKWCSLVWVTWGRAGSGICNLICLWPVNYVVIWEVCRRILEWILDAFQSSLSPVFIKFYLCPFHSWLSNSSAWKSSGNMPIWAMAGHLNLWLLNSRHRSEYPISLAGAYPRARG